MNCPAIGCIARVDNRPWCAGIFGLASNMLITMINNGCSLLISLKILVCTTKGRSSGFEYYTIAPEKGTFQACIPVPSVPLVGETKHSMMIACLCIHNRLSGGMLKFPAC